MTAGKPRRGTIQRVAPGVHLLKVGRTAAASNVYLIESPDSWVLVDTAWASSATIIEAAAESLFGAGAVPSAILLTHIHPDHSGAAGALARSWGVPVFAHPAELPLAAGRYLPEFGMPLDRWVVMPVMRLLPARTRERVEQAGSITDVVRPLDPAGRVPGLPHWQWVPTPGHTPGHVAYLRPEDGVLVSGDAAVTVDLNSLTGVLTGRQKVSGPPRYTTWDWPSAMRSVRMLATLEPRVLAAGHGQPLRTQAAAALQTLTTTSHQRRAHLRMRAALPRYSGKEQYRAPPPLYVRLQWLGFLLTRLGLSPGYVVTLQVRGHRSGQLRRTSLILLDHQGRQYLLALAGQSQWARNVRAADGRAVLTRRGRRRAVTLTEIPVPERPAIIRAYLLRGGRRPQEKRVAREADTYFGVSADPTAAQLEAAAPRYPVFRVTDGQPPEKGRGP